MLLRFAVLLSIFILIGLRIDAQIITISGKVLIEDTSKSIELPLVSLTTNKSIVEKLVQTDSSGLFVLYVKKPGAYQLLINKSGYKEYSSQIIKIDSTITSHIIDLGKIILEKDSSHELASVAVVNKPKFIEHKFNKTIVNIQQSVFAQGNTLFEILPIIPGVKVSQDGAISLHGKTNILLLIDGKGQVVPQDQIADLVKNINASTIEKIEIIHNPPAKYDGSVSGVLNIVTVKKKTKSDIHIGYGSQLFSVPNYNGLNKTNENIGANINTSLHKLAVSINLDYRKNTAQEKSTDNFHFYNTTPFIVRSNNSTRTTDGSNLNFSIGLNYSISKRQYLDLRINTRQNLYGKGNDNQEINFFTNNTSIIDSSIFSIGNTKRRNTYSNTINLKHVLQLKNTGEELSFFGDFYNNGHNTTNNVQNTIINKIVNNRTTTQFSSNLDYYVAIESFKADYTKPLNKSVFLDAGAKAAFVQNKSNYKEAMNLNNFRYNEFISAAYLSLRNEDSKFRYEIGGRIEQTHSKGRVLGNNNIVSRDYNNFFPTISTQYSINDNNSIGLSYKTTIMRPTYEYFNPTTILISPFNYYKGDSTLNPKITRTLQATFTHNDISLIVTSDFQRNVQGSLIDSTSSALYISNSIFAYKHINQFSAELDFPITMNKWWSTSNDLSSYLTIAKLPTNTTNKSTSFDFTSNQSFKVSKSASLNFILMYSYSSKIGYYKYFPIFNTQVAFQKTWNDRFILNININDILGTGKIKFVNDYGYIFDKMTQLNNNRNFRISFRYRFNSGIFLSKKDKTSKDTNSELRF